jgi:hypothetical protein
MTSVTISSGNVNLPVYERVCEWVSHNSVAMVLYEISAAVEEKVFISETKWVLWEAQAETQEIYVYGNWEHRAQQHHQMTARPADEINAWFSLRRNDRR